MTLAGPVEALREDRDVDQFRIVVEARFCHGLKHVRRRCGMKTQGLSREWVRECKSRGMQGLPLHAVGNVAAVHLVGQNGVSRP